MGPVRITAGSLLDAAWAPECPESTTAGGRTPRVADRGFDPRTFGLSAQHASHCASPLSMQTASGGAAREEGLRYDVPPLPSGDEPTRPANRPQLTGQGHAAAGALLHEAWVPERHESTTAGGRSARVADRGFDPRTFGL